MHSGLPRGLKTDSGQRVTHRPDGRQLKGCAACGQGFWCRACAEGAPPAGRGSRAGHAQRARRLPPGSRGWACAVGAPPAGGAPGLSMRKASSQTPPQSEQPAGRGRRPAARWGVPSTRETPPGGEYASRSPHTAALAANLPGDLGEGHFLVCAAATTSLPCPPPSRASSLAGARPSVWTRTRHPA